MERGSPCWCSPPYWSAEPLWSFGAGEKITGNKERTFDMRCSRLYSTPVVADGVVYIGDRCGSFFVVDAETGKEIA